MALLRTIKRLPARSRARQRLLRVGAGRAIAALNRADHEVTFVIFAPDCDSDFSPGLATLGFEATRGLEDRIRAQRSWREDWGEYRFDPREVVDLGDDRVLVTGSFHAQAPASGLPLDSEWGVLATLSAGRIIREQTFWNHSEACEAAGLRSRDVSA
jgi:ketosteroid isomerase-like protein